MEKQNKAFLSFAGTKAQMLRYFNAVDVVSAHDNALNVDKPVTSAMIAKMPQGKLMQRAEIISMRYSNV